MQDVADPISDRFMEQPSDPNELQGLTSRALLQIKDEFSHRTWDVFHRNVIDGIDSAIVAQQFEITPAAVRQTRSRVLRRLRQQLGDIQD